MTPVVLAVMGAAFLVGAMALYGTPTQVPTPRYVTIYLDSTFPINTIDYSVRQISPRIAKVTVEVDLYAAAPPRGAPTAQWQFRLPRGIAFQTCPKRYCVRQGDPAVEVWVQDLKFSTVQESGVATTDLFVKSQSFGKAFNELTASAAMPQIFLRNGSKQPTLLTTYFIPSASSYDWSSFQPYSSSSNYAIWAEQINGGQLDGRAALGVNHSNQAKDETNTFFAGALLGLAGGAFLSAVQEALHAKD